MTRYHTLSIVKIASATIFIAALVAYSIYNSRIFISGPQISIQEPETGAVFEDGNLIRIKGQADNIAYLHLNDRQIYTDESGYFQEPILLRSGYNIVRIEAEDKFGRDVTETVELFYSGSETGTEEIENIEILEENSTTTSTSTTATSSSEI
jgi:hypothetical protein